MPVARPERAWLNEAVGSVLDQHGIDLELVVVDDGSDPPVGELLDRAEDPRLTIVRSERPGVAHARNTGLAAARGEYVRFADADDVLERGSTSRLLALAADGSIAYGATVVCDEALRPQGMLGSDLAGRVEEACLLGRFDVRLPALLFPRAAVEAAGAWDPAFPVCSDWDFVLRALEHAPVRGEPSAAVHYRRHSASITRSAGVAEAESAWARVVDRYFERHPERRGSELERRVRAMQAFHWARAYAYRRETRAAVARLGVALASRPLHTLRALPGLLLLAVRARARR